MSADFARVPTEGMQRLYLRLLTEAVERLESMRDDYNLHDATWPQVMPADDDVRMRWANVRHDLNAHVLGAVDHLLWCLHQARENGALGMLPDLDVEARLRADHAEVSP